MRQRGFTLIEMLVVVALVGVLASAARPILELTARRSQELSLRRNLRILREAIDAHRRAAVDGRIALAADASGYPPSLEVLLTGVPDLRGSKDARIYFLRAMPRDPFAAADVAAGQSWALRSSESPPDAPAAGRDVFDVHSRSERTALDGSVYREW